MLAVVTSHFIKDPFEDSLYFKVLPFFLDYFHEFFKSLFTNDTLKEGIISGAALDTYVHEPPKGSPLLTLENVVTTPHIGSYTYETVLEMGLTSVENLMKVLKGGENR